MSLIFRSAAASDLGLRRENNEDAAYTGRCLLAVADGIGGLPAGEVASELTIQALAELAEDEGVTPADLTAAVVAANRRIGELAAADPAHAGMGTTLTALLLVGDDVAAVHVGDSRAYLLRRAALHQVTRDDTLVQELVDRGALTPADARRHPQRSIVTNALQGQPLEPAAELLGVEKGDRFLLCTDGLSDFVDDDEITTALLHPEPQACVEQLIKLAVQAGAPDNVTVIVADVALPEGTAS
jgi:PPM family protein phosphatase